MHCCYRRILEGAASSINRTCPRPNCYIRTRAASPLFSCKRCFENLQCFSFLFNLGFYAPNASPHITSACSDLVHSKISLFKGFALEFRNHRIFRHGNIAFALPHQCTLSETCGMFSFNRESIYGIFNDRGGGAK